MSAAKSVIPLPMADIVTALRWAMHGDLPISVTDPYPDEALTHHWCGNVELNVGAFRITLYFKDGVIDHVDRAASPHGRACDYLNVDQDITDLMAPDQLESLTTFLQHTVKQQRKRDQKGDVGWRTQNAIDQLTRYSGGVWTPGIADLLDVVTDINDDAAHGRHRSCLEDRLKEITAVCGKIRQEWVD